MQQLKRIVVRTASVAAGALCLCGCSLMTPYQLWQFRADYNSERRWAAQIEVQEHLPPYPVTVRRMLWGYNVGPSPAQSGAWMIPADAPVDPLVPIPSGVRPGGPSKDLLEQAQPPDLPPSPRGTRSGNRNSNREQPEKPDLDPNADGPMAVWPDRIRPIGYQSTEGPVTQPSTLPKSAWLFSR